MVSGPSTSNINRYHQVGDGNKNPNTAASTRGGSRSWGLTFSGQSVSTSGSVGSPSSLGDQATPTPASDSTYLWKNHLGIHTEDAGSKGPAGEKKKRAQRAVGADKSGRGLRQFSMKVCEKVESKGRTTYNEEEL